MKKVAVLQSNYIPWKGYFDMINMVDLFIFYDNVQYTKNDWRNRNKIKTPKGTQWLSVPTGQNINRLICEVELTDSNWQKQHWRLITKYYADTKYFESYRNFFAEIYLEKIWTNLSELNQYVIKKISKEILNSTTKFEDSRKYPVEGTKEERLINLLKRAKASHYISGPAAKDYIDPDSFKKANITLGWIDYSGYPEYPQKYASFEHGVSILDLIFNTGPDSTKYMKSFD